MFGRKKDPEEELNLDGSLRFLHQSGLPKSICSHSLHKVIAVNFSKEPRLAHDAGIGEENIQPAIFCQCIVNDRHYGLFICCVKLPCVDFHGRVERLNLTLVRCKMGIAEVTNIDCFGAVVGKLMRAGAADACGGIGP